MEQYDEGRVDVPQKTKSKKRQSKNGTVLAQIVAKNDLPMRRYVVAHRQRVSQDQLRNIELFRCRNSSEPVSVQSEVRAWERTM